VALLGAAMVEVEVEAEVEAEEGEEVEETGGGGEVAVLEAVTAAVEVAQWVEVVPPAVALVGAAGVTSVSGRRTSKQFILLDSRRKGTGWSRGSRLTKTTHLNSLSVRFFNLIQTPIFTVSFRRSRMGNTW